MWAVAIFAMATPPCQPVADRRAQFAQTYVIKVCAEGENTSPIHWLTSQIVSGAGGGAMVKTVQGDMYIVITEAKAHRVEGRSRAFRESISQLPGSPPVEWIRPMTRRLQRLFGWGDVATTREDVARTAKAGNLEELRTIMPQAARFIDREELELLPALHDALSVALVPPAPQNATALALPAPAPQNATALALPAAAPPPPRECRHEFFRDQPGAIVDGPCCHGPAGWSPEHRSPFTRCGAPCQDKKGKKGELRGGAPAPPVCRMVCCYECARSIMKRQEREAVLQAALQECAQPPRDPFAPTCEWQQHPTRPLPFYVVDQVKVSEADKLAWMQQELGDDVKLPTFAEKFMELFGDKLRGGVPQRAACLKLFRQHAPDSTRAWKTEGDHQPKESDLPPADREAFLRVWDPSVKCCRDCGTRHERRGGYCSDTCAGGYCSDTCAAAGVIVACRECKATLDPATLVPTTPARPCAFCGPKGGKRGHGLLVAQRTWFCGRRPDPEHEPAWKKARRS